MANQKDIGENGELVLARSQDGVFIDIPKNALLIKENKITKGISIERKFGLGFAFPGLFFNTIVYYKRLFKKEFDQEKLDSANMPEVRLRPHVTLKIVNPKKFYEQICGRDAESLITADSSRLNDVYKDVFDVIRRIVKSSNFEDISKIEVNTRSQKKKTKEEIRLEKISQIQKIKESNYGFFTKLKMIRKIKKGIDNDDRKIYVQNSSMSPEAFSEMTKGFTQIVSPYGIQVVRVGFIDITKSEAIQKAEEQAKEAEYKREIAKKDAEAQLEIAKKEAEAMKTRINAYRQSGLSDEQIAQILMTQNSNGTTVVSIGQNHVDPLVAQLLQQNSNNSNTDSNTNGRSK